MNEIRNIDGKFDWIEIETKMVWNNNKFIDVNICTYKNIIIITIGSSSYTAAKQQQQHQL